MRVKITIIVPIYNVEKYLRECLNSIANQTNKNFVAILVDDGSVDSSPKIAKEYALKYPKIFKYVRQENKGPGGARNTGIKLSETDWITFLDSDDLMSPKAIEYAINSINKYFPDILIALPAVFDNISGSTRLFNDCKKIQNIFKNNLILNTKSHPELMSIEASVNRLYIRKDLILKNNLWFATKQLWEDIVFRFVLLSLAEKIMLINYQNFFYRVNEKDEITNSTGIRRLEVTKVIENTNEAKNKYKWSKKEYWFSLNYLLHIIIWSYKIIDYNLVKKYVKSVGLALKSIKYLDFINTKRATKISNKQLIFVFCLKSPILRKFLYKREEGIVWKTLRFILRRK